MKSLIFTLFAVFVVVTLATDFDAEVPASESTVMDTSEDFVSVEAQDALAAKEQNSMFETADIGMHADATAKQMQMQMMSTTLDQLNTKHPNLAVTIGVVDYAKLQDKKDGYGEMKNIMKAVDDLAKKIQAEAKKNLEYITGVREKCARDIAKYKRKIELATRRVKVNGDLIKEAIETKRISEINRIKSQVRELKYAGIVKTTESKKTKMSDGYWERRNKRDKERRILKLAIFLTCDFRAFEKHEYCVYLKAHKVDADPKGCDIAIQGQCVKEKLTTLKFEDELGYITEKSDINEKKCAQRAIYWYERCGNGVTNPVSAKFRKTSVTFKYPTQDLKNWLREREVAIQNEEKEFNTNMEKKRGERALAYKKKLETMEEEDVNKRKAAADASGAGKKEAKAASTLEADFLIQEQGEDALWDQQRSKMEELAEQSAKGDVGEIDNILRNKEQAHWTKKQIAHQRWVDSHKFYKVLNATKNTHLYNIMTQTMTMMQDGELDSTDEEATAALQKKRKTLVDMLKGLRARMKEEQLLEDKDYKEYLHELQSIISKNTLLIRDERTLQGTLHSTIQAAIQQKITSEQIVKESTEELAGAAKALLKTKEFCRNEDDTYLMNKFMTDEEIVNVEKLRSVLRVLANSKLPKCPGDCTDLDHGKCIWKGRFGADSYCACEPEWYGKQCQKRKCPGRAKDTLYEKLQDGACTHTRRGTCDNSLTSKTKGECKCKANYYHGPNKACEYKRCPGNADYDPALDPNQKRACNKRGWCNIRTGTCTCHRNSRYYGEACEHIKCYNYRLGQYLRHTNRLSCNNRGTCDSKTGECKCNTRDLYHGRYCEKKGCQRACIGGTCTNNGTCSCTGNRYGSYCQFLRCPTSCRSNIRGNYCDRNKGRCYCRNPHWHTHVYSGPRCDLSWRFPNENVRHKANHWNLRNTGRYLAYARGYWWSSFDRHGWSTCDSAGSGKFIVGFWYNWCGGIYCIEETYCVKPVMGNVNWWGQAYSGGRILYFHAHYCSTANWWSSFDRAGWSYCPGGSFLQGLYRNWCHNLWCIEAARCCYIVGSYRSNCQHYHWGWGRNGLWVGTSDHHYLWSALHRQWGDNINRIDGAYRCNHQSY